MDFVSKLKTGMFSSILKHALRVCCVLLSDYYLGGWWTREDITLSLACNPWRLDQSWTRGGNCHGAWKGLGYILNKRHSGSRIQATYLLLITGFLSGFCCPSLLGTSLCSCWKCWSEGKEMVANRCGWSHNLLMWGSLVWFAQSLSQVMENRRNHFPSNRC